jgi:hypothetical protein
MSSACDAQSLNEWSLASRSVVVLSSPGVKRLKKNSCFFPEALNRNSGNDSSNDTTSYF